MASAPRYADPRYLGPEGRSMWNALLDKVPTEDGRITLLEACRCRDRLERFDQILRGDTDTWAEVELDRQDFPVSLTIDKAAALAVSTQNMMKQLIAALRLPGADGKPSSSRGGNPGTPRQPYRKGAPKVSSLDKARQRAEGR